MKHSKFIVLLTVLLIAVMAFSSCSGSTAQLSPEPADDLDKEVVTELLDGVTLTETEKLKAAYAAWAEYFDPIEAPAKETLTAKEINFSKWSTGNEETIGDYTSYELLDWDVFTPYYIALRVDSFKQNPENTEEPDHTRVSSKVVVYSSKYKDMEEPIYVGHESYVAGFEPEEQALNQYSYVLQGHTGLFIKKTKTLTDVPIVPAPTEPDAPTTEKQYLLTKVEYLFANGETLVSFDITDNEDITHEIDFDDNNNVYYLTVEDKVYTFNRDYTLLATADKAMFIPFPVYPSFEIEGYKFFKTADKVQVLNEKYIETAVVITPRATVDSSSRAIVLSNGNIFVQRMVRLDSGENGYDVKLYGEYFNIVQSIVDFKTGAVTELEESFLVADMYTKYTGGYANSNVAAVVKFEKGASVSNELDYVVFNDDMTVKAELPELFKNQDGLIQMLSSGALVALELGNESVYVKVNSDGNIQLMPDLGRIANLTPYLLTMSNGKIYDISNPNNTVSEIGRPVRTQKINDNAILAVFEYESSDEIYYRLNYIYVDENGRVVTLNLINGADTPGEFMFDIIGDSIIGYKADDRDMMYMDHSGHILFSSDFNAVDNTDSSIIMLTFSNNSNLSYKYYFVK